MPSQEPPVAVFGATGTQGGAVVDALLERGARIRALVRDPDSARAGALAARGVELAHADLANPATLPAALEGAAAFFFMTTPFTPEGTEGEVRQGRALADAAAQARVPHVVFNSVGGAERHTGIPHFESKRRVEERIQQLGLDATVIRPVFFMENLSADNMAPQGGPEDGALAVTMPLPDDVPLQMVAARDVGIVSAAALLGRLPDGVLTDGAVEIAGDERTGSQIAAAFAEHTGRPVTYRPLPLDVLDGNEDMQAMFRWFAQQPAYQGDLAATRRIDPDAWDLPAWLRNSGRTPAG